MILDLDVDQYRNPDHEIEDLLYHRWSPRAMSGDAVSQADLDRLFEAARWAPSSYNGQPWRFLYAHRDTDHWDTFFGLLGDFNQAWCDDAGVLVVIVSSETRDGDPAPTHSFDTGSAWQNLALQARAMKLVAHGMSGFDYDAAREKLGVPQGFTVEAMVAVGHPGEVEELPEGMRKMEQPNSRKPVSELAFEGPFPG